MGGAPTIVWLRDGVGYAADAAASMARLEVAFRKRYGRNRTCNSTYRDYGLQLSMWQAWTAWAEGRGPKPNHSRALHPDESKHCQGLADDTNEWTTPGYIELAEERGWIRTAANDPTERHHFEYQWWRDRYRFEGWPAGHGSAPAPVKTPEQIEEDELMGAKDDIIADTRKNADRVISAVRREGRFRAVADETGRHALVREGTVIRLADGTDAARDQMKKISEANPLLLPPDEFAGILPKLETPAFFTLIDMMEDPEHGFGRFVKNTFELDGGDTRMLRADVDEPTGRTDLVIPYRWRGLVWQDTRPVEITVGGVVARRFLARGTERLAELVDGRTVTLTQQQVDRANAQRPAGQVWGAA